MRSGLVADSDRRVARVALLPVVRSNHIRCVQPLPARVRRSGLCAREPADASLNLADLKRCASETWT